MFDTSEVDEWTLGGDLTQDEMCYFFIQFAPKVHDTTSNPGCRNFNDAVHPARKTCDRMMGEDTENWDDCYKWEFDYWWDEGTDEHMQFYEFDYRWFEFTPRRDNTCAFDIPDPVKELYADTDNYRYTLTPQERATYGIERDLSIPIWEYDEFQASMDEEDFCELCYTFQYNCAGESTAECICSNCIDECGYFMAYACVNTVDQCLVWWDHVVDNEDHYSICEDLIKIDNAIGLDITVQIDSYTDTMKLTVAGLATGWFAVALSTDAIMGNDVAFVFDNDSHKVQLLGVQNGGSTATDDQVEFTGETVADTHYFTVDIPLTDYAHFNFDSEFYFLYAKGSGAWGYHDGGMGASEAFTMANFAIDCMGTIGGSAVNDQCGVCEGTDDCLDCLGQPFGDAKVDDCGICDGNNANKDDCGVCDGNNDSMDEHGICAYQHLELERLVDTTLTWQFDDAKEMITITLNSAMVDHWIGFGVSASGGMIFAEQYICDPEDQSLKHTWSEKNGVIEILEENSDHLDSFEVTADSMTCVFTIPVHSCLGENYDIQLHTTRIIYAAGPKGTWYQHSGDYRGHYQVLFHVNEAELEADLPEIDNEEFFEWEFHLDNVELPNDDPNSYYCTFAHHPDTLNYREGGTMAPEDAGEVPTTYIVNADLNNFSPYVHHVIMFACSLEFSYFFDSQSEHAAGEPFECRDMNVPCQNIVSIWLPGLEYGARDNYGFEVGGHAFHTLLFQIHYNNPDLTPNVVDSSGMTFIYTPVVQPTLLWISLDGLIQNTMILPPNEAYYRYAKVQPPECTEEWVDRQEIHAINVHMHGLGKRARVSIVRDGQEQQVLLDVAFDYDFQTYYRFEPGVVMEKGDQLYTECMFDTSEVDHYTFGGDKTEDEMCYFFIQYAPKEHGHEPDFACWQYNDAYHPARKTCEVGGGGMWGMECYEFENDLWTIGQYYEIIEKDGFDYRWFDYVDRRENNCAFDLPQVLQEFYADEDYYRYTLTPQERATYGIDRDVTKPAWEYEGWPAEESDLCEFCYIMDCDFENEFAECFCSTCASDCQMWISGACAETTEQCVTWVSAAFTGGQVSFCEVNPGPDGCVEPTPGGLSDQLGAEGAGYTCAQAVAMYGCDADLSVELIDMNLGIDLPMGHTVAHECPCSCATTYTISTTSTLSVGDSDDVTAVVTIAASGFAKALEVSPDSVSATLVTDDDRRRQLAQSVTVLLAYTTSDPAAAESAAGVVASPTFSTALEDGIAAAVIEEDSPVTVTSLTVDDVSIPDTIDVPENDDENEEGDDDAENEGGNNDDENEVTESSDDGLSGGAVAGIVIGCLAVAVVVGYVIYWMVTHEKEEAIYKPNDVEMEGGKRTPGTKYEEPPRQYIEENSL